MKNFSKIFTFLLLLPVIYASNSTLDCHDKDEVACKNEYLQLLERDYLDELMSTIKDMVSKFISFANDEIPKSTIPVDLEEYLTSLKKFQTSLNEPLLKIEDFSTRMRSNQKSNPIHTPTVEQTYKKDFDQIRNAEFKDILLKTQNNFNNLYKQLNATKPEILNIYPELTAAYDALICWSDIDTNIRFEKSWENLHKSFKKILLILKTCPHCSEEDIKEMPQKCSEYKYMIAQDRIIKQEQKFNPDN